MEQLLLPENQFCVKCRTPFLFRQCKYGCEFGCKCGRSTFDSVLTAYVSQLHSEVQQSLGVVENYVPCVRGAKVEGTMSERIVSVEVDFSARRALVHFKNIDKILTHFVKESLSSAVLSELAHVDHDAFTIPLELMDLLLFELRSLAQGKFFVNAPSDAILRLTCTNPSDPQHAAVEIPAPLRSYLQKHQMDGVRRIVHLGGRALLCDEMGVGKTLTALGVICALKVFPVLVVCPSSVKHIWAEEIERFLVPQLVPLEHLRVIRSSNDAFVTGEVPQVVIISYHMTARLSAMIRETPWQCIVCDESHLLHTNTSGSDALYTTLICDVAKQATFCLLLSGTPVTTGAFDLFNQIDALHPGWLGTARLDFALRYCAVTVDPFLKIGSCVRQHELSSLLDERIMVRRRKREVLDLPSKQRILYPIEEEAASDREYETGGNFQRRYKSHWVLRKTGISHALDYLRATNEQVVLFAHHVELLDFLETEVKRRKETFLVIKGGVDMDARQHLLRNFAEKKIKFAIVGISACSVGVSLASSSCAVFCELPPNATLMKQAEDRLHRPGQAAKATFYYFVGQRSLFDKVLFERLKKDDDEVRRLIDGDDSPLPFSFTTRSATCDNKAGPEAPMGTLSEAAMPCARQLLFTVSRYTGRLHVKGEGSAFYATLTIDEARRCVRERNHPAWRQMGDFLFNYDTLSSYEQRQLRGSWHTTHIQFRSKNKPTGKRHRYKLPFRCGWGFWSEIKTQKFSLVLFCPLLKSDSRIVSVCLECGRGLSTGMEAARPGQVRKVTSDVGLFCSGACREHFYLNAPAHACVASS
ncbi:hypothetical protein STCU_09371 [Strigomonas culicis]|uniref:SNF2 DNA repair protein n=1 Tax=Strigomonas culicis TaxID=28005 RepID=S9TSZ1_9TRYP|nr:hypothetical protein STCU_09371 [Strigomonas culicis]|eukprot:EPY19603.1 hypothetical protein STCU_09371 [Strigomonas culicis]